MIELIHDIHLPTILDELKKSMEVITTSYDSFNQHLHTL